SKRTRVATLESNLAAWDYEAKRLDVFTAVVKAFTEVVAAQVRVQVNKELLVLAEEFVKTIERRVKAGKVSLAEASRAKVELSVATMELERSRRILLASRQRLAATWGSAEPEFDRVAGALDIPSSIPSFEKIASFVQDNPDIALWVTEMDRRRAKLELEKAMRIPDPTVIGGYRRLNETTDNAFIVGLSIPITIFNRNQGAILEAEYRLKQTRSQRQAVETTIKSRLAEQYQMLSVLYNEARTLKDKIIPDARNAFEIINRGYLLGKFAALDVLDAQRTLFEVRGRYLQSLTDFHKTAADIERIIGRRLTDVQ
ncbi:MAG: TolC family protein, partial [Chlorobi bacterium]|nr:TolC family protein [Chlorobiota bacterium]